MPGGPKPPVTLAQLRDMIAELRDDLGELGGELLHRSDEVLSDLALIKSRLPIRKADKRGRRAVHPKSET